MKKESTIFSEVWIIKPDVYEDSRGFFYESYSYKKIKELGFDITFVQDNHSKSIKNTVRGIHFQANPGQIKLVRCTKGSIWDVVVDLRPDSITFKKWIGVELSETNFLELLIPVGFGHGFTVLSDVAEVQYKTSNYYDPRIERGIRWNDPNIGVDWRTESPLLSSRDNSSPFLDELLIKYQNPFEL